MERLTASAVTICAECHLPLPLRRPRNPRDARLWRCANCDTLYLRVVDLLASDDLLLNIYPAEVPMSGTPNVKSGCSVSPQA